MPVLGSEYLAGDDASYILSLSACSGRSLSLFKVSLLRGYRPASLMAYLSLISFSRSILCYRALFLISLFSIWSR